MYKIDISGKFNLLSEQWRPKVIAELNGQEMKLVKLKGEFVWHRHDAEDELFLVWRGTLRVDFPDGSIELHKGECIVVPRGVEHRTAAVEEAEIIVFEPAGTRNTGNVDHPTYSAPQGEKL